MNDIIKPEAQSVTERLAALPPEVQALFGKAKNGKPDNISQEGCFALARLGSDNWNAWREAFPVVSESTRYTNVADFFGVNFQGRQIDFSDFLFGDGADFRGARWGDGENFQRARWGDRANFQDAQWGRNADFQGALWGHSADFQGTKWGKEANFQDAQWGNEANFYNVQWWGSADFQYAKWGDEADFQYARWGCEANFRGAQWGDSADFQGAQWSDSADFRGAQWGDAANFQGAQWGNGANFQSAQWGNGANFRGAQWSDRADFQYAKWGKEANFQGAQWGLPGDVANFQGAQWSGGANFQGASWEVCRQYYLDDEHYQTAKKWAEERGLSPNSFQSISFAGAYFADEVDFSNRKFTGQTDFGKLPTDYQRRRVLRDANGRVLFNKKGELRWEKDPEPRRHVLFEKAPKFHGCELHQDTTFDDAEFPPASGSDEAARAYRTLKLAFSKQQALREEQRFFKLEMEEEAKQAGVARLLFWLYGFFSDYGFSLWRPLLVFFVALVIFAFWYGSYDKVPMCWSIEPNCMVQWPWLNYSLAQSLPLTGFDKLPSLETLKNNVPVWLLALHKILSLACLFLAGLALRNLFRLK